MAKKNPFSTALKTVIPQTRSGLSARKPKTKVSFERAQQLAHEAGRKHQTPYVYVDPKTAEVKVSHDGENWYHS